MRACFLLPFLTLAVFVADPSLAMAAHKASGKAYPAKYRERKKTYLRRTSIVSLSPQDRAVWRGRTLRVITALHMDERGLFVYPNEIGKSLAKVYRVSEWVEPVRRAKGKNHLKKVWACQECGLGLEDQNDLYDHVCREQKLN